MPIQIFVTGGTFDKEYDELEQKLVLKQTHIPEMLELSRCRLQLEIATLMLMDSSLIQAHDRERISNACRESRHEMIVITHGTDTMAETAAFVAQAKLAKTIVLTGAMVPYQLGTTDGLFNLGCALAFVQTLPHGVYVSMNGRCFAHNNVRKDVSQGIFQTIRCNEELKLR